MLRYIKTITRRVLRMAGVDIVKWHNAPESTLLGLDRESIRTIFDIGANVGQSARAFRSRFPNAQILSFEPLPIPFAKLNDWANTQQGMVKAINLALGSQTGPAEIREHLDFSASSSFLPSTKHSTEMFPQITRQQTAQVSVARLDDVARELKLESGILVKMDVQGFEEQVILGGLDLLKKADACIIEVSLQPLYEGQPSFMDLCRLLNEADLEYAGNIVQIYDEQGRVIYLDALFRKKSSDVVFDLQQLG